MSSLEQQLARAVSELQVLERALEELQGSVAALRAALSEHERALELLEELKARGSASSILVPIGGGNMIEAEVKSVEEVYVSLGAGVVMRQPIDQAIELMKRRMESLNSALRTREEALASYAQRADELRRLVEALYRRLSEARQASEGGKPASG
ncbi:MAG: prefoldin subunit alpha [Aigarchaeota archaeon]|nr:prefoldin subunit alpha [Candidatus Wolframiiraptor gerlachensis]